jgi:transcriptional regulatory protein LevR
MWSDSKNFNYKEFERQLIKYSNDLNIYTVDHLINIMKHTLKYLDKNGIIFLEFLHNNCYFSVAGTLFKRPKKYIKIIENKIREYKTSAYLYTKKKAVYKIAKHLGYKVDRVIKRDIDYYLMKRDLI